MSHISFLYKHCAMILITFAIDENYNNQKIIVTYSASAQILSHRAVDSLYSYIVYLETEYALDNDNLVWDFLKNP